MNTDKHRLNTEFLSAFIGVHRRPKINFFTTRWRRHSCRRCFRRRVTTEQKCRDARHGSADRKSRHGRQECPMPLSFRVGRTPWSAADALVGLPRTRKRLVSLGQERVQGDPRGPGVRPTSHARFPVLGKLSGIRHSCLPGPGGTPGSSGRFSPDLDFLFHRLAEKVDVPQRAVNMRCNAQPGVFLVAHIRRQYVVLRPQRLANL